MSNLDWPGTDLVCGVKLVEHDDGLAASVVQQSPEILLGVRQRHLRRHEAVFVLETLKHATFS